MPQFKIYETSFTDIEDGELVDPDTSEDTIDCTPDEYDIKEGVSATDKAIEYLTDSGNTEISTSPYPRTGSMAGIWFSYVDGSYVSNYYTGERIETSAHPEGFTDDELRAICEGINTR